MQAFLLKKAITVLFSLALVFFTSKMQAQKVGIGTNAPRQVLHISAATDSNLVLLENRTSLDTLIRTSLYFRTGSYYTGSIKTVGEGNFTSRLAFYTYAFIDSSKLRERMTIRDNGNVGIGTPNPNELLDVAGRGKFTTSNSSTAALTGINTGNDFLNAGIRGMGQYMGTVGAADGGIGIGVLGYNNSLGVGPFYENGVGVEGFSNASNGVAGITTRTLYAGVYGKPMVNGGYGGWFTSNSGSYSNTLALLTTGAIRHSGIGEGVGKVLTSDASGNATWQSPATPIGFSAYLTADYATSNNVAFLLGAMTEMFDQGNMFTNGASSFTAPVSGMYMVSLSLRFSPSNATGIIYVDTKFYVNGNNFQNTNNLELITGLSSSTFSQTHINSRLLNLTAGDVVTVAGVFTYSASSLAVKGGNAGATTTLSAFKVN